MAQIYGKVNGPDDIRRINCIIRDEMLVVENVEQLTDLKKRSDYLCTLTYSPFWLKKFGSMIEELREVAMEENRITVRLANIISKYKWFDKQYDWWWNDDKSIEEKLQAIPQEVIEELWDKARQLKLSPEILDEIRKSYCKIRAAMVLSQSEIQLTLLKKQSDIIKAIISTREFKERFEEVYQQIVDLVEKEEEKTITLANIIASVRDYFVTYHIWSDDQIPDNETLQEYISKLLKEEEKSQQYIPTEAKYNEGVVYWLVYKHPSRDRYYAKRVYFSTKARDIQVIWPDVFENKFGRKVYWVKIIYYTYVKPTIIHKWNIEIHLPERWVKREKVIPLPEWVKQVELKEDRPEFAYPVA